MPEKKPGKVISMAEFKAKQLAEHTAEIKKTAMLLLKEREILIKELFTFKGDDGTQHDE